LEPIWKPRIALSPGPGLAILPCTPWGGLWGSTCRAYAQCARHCHRFLFDGESAFASALATAFALYIFLQLGIAPKNFLAGCGNSGLATPLAAYSGWLLSEPLAAALIDWRCGRPVCLAAGNAHPLGSRSRPGTLLGAAIWVRPTHVIIVPIFLIALILREREKGWSAATALAVAAGVGVALLFGRNAYLHGNLFDFGYPSAAEGGKALNTFERRSLPVFSDSDFSRQIYFSVFAADATGAGGAAAFMAARSRTRFRGRRRADRLSAVFATYTQWRAAIVTARVIFVPALALLGLGVGPALVSLTSIDFEAGFCLSQHSPLGDCCIRRRIFVQAIGTTISFLEADVAGGYYDAQYNYRMSFSPIAMHIHLLAHYATSGGRAYRPRF